MKTADGSLAHANQVLVEVIGCDPARVAALTGYAWDDASGYQLGVLDESGWTIFTTAGEPVGPITNAALFSLMPRRSGQLINLVERTQREIS